MSEKLPIIALMGKAQSGKDTAGLMLLDMGLGARLAFAHKLKFIIGELFEIPDHNLYDDKGKEEPLSQFPAFMCPTCMSIEVETYENDGRKYAACKMCKAAGERKVFESCWTGRKISQFIGTECFRRVWPKVWTNWTIKDARHILGHTKNIVVAKDFVVITDCRFPEEVAAVKEAGGEVWRIKRAAASVGLKGHESETAQDKIPDAACAAVIDNNGSLEALRGKLTTEFDRFLAARR